MKTTHFLNHVITRFWLTVFVVCLSPLYLSSDAFALAAREAIDGDTLILDNGERVRLIGIDTPEIEDTYRRNAKTAKFENLRKGAVDTYAIEARSAAQKWIEGQELKLIHDPSNDARGHRDDYGRTLAYVCRESDKRCLAEDLLTGGYALVYKRFDFGRKPEFLALQAQAKESRAGVWKHTTLSPVSKKKKT